MNLTLKMAIAAKGTTQTVVAKRAGISEARLSRIIHEHQQPSEDEKSAIAKALRLKVHDLFSEVAA